MPQISSEEDGDSLKPLSKETEQLLMKMVSRRSIFLQAGTWQVTLLIQNLNLMDQKPDSSL